MLLKAILLEPWPFPLSFSFFFFSVDMSSYSATYSQTDVLGHQGPKQWDQSVIDWNLQNCEPE
jgi:hypothetical protein